MGYPVPASAPKLFIGGSQYAVAALINPSPVGDFLFVGIYIEVAPNGWNLAYNYAVYPGSLLEDVKVYGGMKGYVAAMIAAMNNFLKMKFGNAAPPPATTGEPTTDAEALAALIAEISRLKFTVVDGVPVLG